MPSKKPTKVHSVLENTASLPLLPDPLFPRVVVPVRAPSVGQIDLFKSYLKGTLEII